MGYKIDTQISLQLNLYTNSDNPEKVIKKIVVFIIAFKSVKYIIINLTKEVPTWAWKTTKHCWEK
jgi:hypothetical protein